VTERSRSRRDRRRSGSRRWRKQRRSNVDPSVARRRVLHAQHVPVSLGQPPPRRTRPATTSSAMPSTSRERMAGRQALNPMGWDAFRTARGERRHRRAASTPRDYTLGNIARMKEQLRALGLLYDWSRSSPPATRGTTGGTSGSSLRMWERGLAYRKTAPVNWCRVPDRARQRAGRRRALRAVRRLVESAT
jgi:hypothetical protein